MFVGVRANHEEVIHIHSNNESLLAWAVGSIHRDRLMENAGVIVALSKTLYRIIFELI